MEIKKYLTKMDIKKCGFPVADITTKVSRGKTCSCCESKKFDSILGVYICMGKHSNGNRYISKKDTWAYGCKNFIPTIK